MAAATHTVVEGILGRPEHVIDLTTAAAGLSGERVLVTGAAGSIGSAVGAVLTDGGVEWCATDITGGVDVRDPQALAAAFQWGPSVVVHLAGAKHAPDAELDPAGTFDTNVGGTRNVLAAAAGVGARVVTASTCKACDPETVYGATKLLAERLTLAAGGSVTRFFNVVESSGNVFGIWEQLEPFEQVPVTPCSRWFITLHEAAALVVAAASSPPGRYCVNPGRRPRPMPAVAAAVYPDRTQVFIPARRGDRQDEPLHSRSEHVMPVNGWMWQVHSTHDAPVAG